jgi:protoheme IX farnesyltransferase
LPTEWTTAATEDAALRPFAALRRGVGLVLELTKARLSLLVVITAAVGYILAADGLNAVRMLWTLLGTALAAGGANALNQWIEITPDGRVPRTAGRPLPTERVAPGPALLCGLALGGSGVLVLLTLVNAAAGLLALTTLLLYVLLYTPMKMQSPTNTLIGAVVGALPPMIGWVAARGEIGVGAWILAGILFVWQVPHFLALAWLYRDQYARGGYRMLPNCDPEGHLTGLMAVLYALALIPVSLLLTFAGICGFWYAGGAVVLGGALVAASVALERQRSERSARRLFVASVIYLPLLMILMVADRGRPGGAGDEVMEVRRTAISAAAAPDLMTELENPIATIE